MPSRPSPRTTAFRGEVSAHSAISASFWRSLRCAGRAKPGIMTRPRMSLTKWGAAAGGSGDARRSRTDFEWQTRVVTRRITGMWKRAESSKAASAKS